MVGLQKRPPRIGSADWERASDRRYEHRIQAWIEANQYVIQYRDSSNEIKEAILPLITTIVIHQGFWSIWMKVFAAFPEIQIELVNSFSGTNKNYFPNLFTAT